jgi:hypothetical protein
MVLPEMVFRINAGIAERGRCIVERKAQSRRLISLPRLSFSSWPSRKESAESDAMDQTSQLRFVRYGNHAQGSKGKAEASVIKLKALKGPQYKRKDS